MLARGKEPGDDNIHMACSFTTFRGFIVVVATILGTPGAVLYDCIPCVGIHICSGSFGLNFGHGRGCIITCPSYKFTSGGYNW